MDSEDKAPLKSREVTMARIVHNDLELGHSTIVQTRGKHDTRERQIELPFIFRTIEEIKALDTTRYTRVQLHMPGQNWEYWYDAGSGVQADDDTVLQPYAVRTVGRWLKVEYVDVEARRQLERIRNALIQVGILDSDG